MKKDILQEKSLRQKFLCGDKKGKWNELPAGGIIDKPGTSKSFKTGDWRQGKKPKWIPERCIQCMQCWVNCPDKAIPAKKGERKETDFNYCKGCGICAKVCPTKAIEMIKEEK